MISSSLFRLFSPVSLLSLRVFRPFKIPSCVLLINQPLCISVPVFLSLGCDGLWFSCEAVWHFYGVSGSCFLILSDLLFVCLFFYFSFEKAGVVHINSGQLSKCGWMQLICMHSWLMKSRGGVRLLGFCILKSPIRSISQFLYAFIIKHQQLLFLLEQHLSCNTQTHTHTGVRSARLSRVDHLC